MKITYAVSETPIGAAMGWCGSGLGVAEGASGCGKECVSLSLLPITYGRALCNTAEPLAFRTSGFLGPESHFV